MSEPLIDIVTITTGARPQLLAQTIESMLTNSAERPMIGVHTLVLDSSDHLLDLPGDLYDRSVATLVVSSGRRGASASRNSGAGSIPKNRRHKYVMFTDDDVYMLPGWDGRLLTALELLPDRTVVSGHAHPFNRPTGSGSLGNPAVPCRVQFAGVLSTVHLVMPWRIWDDVGDFVEPGGPGGSEDVEWCARAVKKGYTLAVTDPMCVVHCGLTSSSGQQIVGYPNMVALNKQLVGYYGLTGKVHWE